MATPIKTPQEIADFLNQPDIVFNTINGKQSIKTNFLIISRNFKALAIYLSKLTSFVKYLYSLIDIQNLIIAVIDALATSKITLQIKFDQLVDTSVMLEVNKKIYKVYRVDDYHIEITNESVENWIVDKLMIQVKQLDGTFVYPTIRTIESKLDIYFPDGISTNYNIYLL